MADTKLADGFFFERPRAGAPDFVKGRMSVKVDEAVGFLQENKNEKGYVNLDLLLAKNKENLYFKLNEWKPKAVEHPTEEEDNDIAANIPF